MDRQGDVMRYVMVVLATAYGCGGSTGVQTTIGPETKGVVKPVTGYVVWTGESGQLNAVRLPDLREHIVRSAPSRAPDGSRAHIHALSGPDAQGRIAFYDNYFDVGPGGSERHLLKTIKIDGTNESTIFARPYELIWSGGEEFLALSPSGGRVAFLSDVSKKQMPGALLHEGNIEIWDVEKKSKLDVTARAIDQPMSWFPDGERLAFVRMISKDETSGTNMTLPPYRGQTWDEAPAIYILDVRNASVDFVDFGWMPVVAADGEKMIVGSWSSEGELIFQWRLFDLETRKSAPCTCPGGVTPIAVGQGDVVIYRGLPTAGASVQLTKNNSPLSGPKPMQTIKAAPLDSSNFETLVPYIDPRAEASFGATKDKSIEP